MDSDVPLEIEGVVESFPTEGAQVALHQAVALVVAVEHALAVECFTAHSACERLFSAAGACCELDFGPGSGVFDFITQKRFIGIIQHCFCVTGDRLVFVCCGLDSSYFKH